MRIIVLAKSKKTTDSTGTEFYVPIRSEISWIFNLTAIKDGSHVWFFDISEQVLFHLGRKRYYKLFKVKFLPKYIKNFASFFTLYRKFRNKFQVAHIFYLRQEFQLVGGFIKRFSPVTVLTIFGTDFYDHCLPFFFRNLLKKCTYYTTTFDGLNNRIFLRFGHFLAEKNFIIPLPIMYFDAAEHYSPGKAEAKKALGIPENKHVVICGTRAGYEEQYEKVLNQLSKIKDPSIIYIFTLTYGDSRKNTNKMEKKIKGSLGAAAMVIKEFQPIETIIDIRCAGDIFINLRSHDQLAGSMIESFYSKNLIITGSWLEYHLLKADGFYFECIDRFEELPAKLNSCINLIEDGQMLQLLEANRIKVLEKYSNELTQKKWEILYNEVSLL
jgi:hypothetical protein